MLIPLYCLSAKNLGQIGMVYPIVEPDALKEIKEKAAAVDWNAYINSVKSKIPNFKPTNVKKLKTAKKDRIFTVDPTYTLEYNIVDHRGNIVYPKGYTFNPLDYVHYPNKIVVINGANEKQVNWFTNLPFAKNINTVLLISDGSYEKLSKKLKRPVFYLTENIANRLKIEAVPSIIQQKGNLLEVKEINVEEKSSKL